ncbi:MAG: hypothetical protein FWE21_05735 [Defluviitaleaceae bacterium]|nr:hypothetical protein [Defluviitaleaceae bacterium]
MKSAKLQIFMLVLGILFVPYYALIVYSYYINLYQAGFLVLTPFVVVYTAHIALAVAISILTVVLRKKVGIAKILRVLGIAGLGSFAALSITQFIWAAQLVAGYDILRLVHNVLPIRISGLVLHVLYVIAAWKNVKSIAE